MTRLTGELAELFTKRQELEQKIRSDWGRLGMSCREWNEVKLRDICTKIISGGTPSRKVPSYFVNGTYRWVKTQELKDCNIYETEEWITEDGLHNSSAKICPINTISMAMYGATVGKLGIFKTNVQPIKPVVI